MRKNNIIRKRNLFIILLIVFTLWGNLSIAQNQTLSFEHITSDDDLPNSTILDILQDKKGFIWFASRNGLYRYDGYNFTSFKADENNEHALSDNFISYLFEDSEGIIYVGTWDQGLNIYNSNKENFIRYTANNINYSIGSNKIRCIKEDSKGVIWIGTADNGFYSFNKNEKKFTSFSLPPECINNCIDMVVDKDDNLWMTNSMLELVKFVPKKNEFIVNKVFSSNQKSDEILSKLILDKKGNIWIGANFLGLYYYNVKNNSTKHWSNDINNPKGLISNLISDIHETNDGQLWIATDGGGIDIFDVEKDEFYHNTSNLNDPESLSTNAIYCLYVDRNHNIWVGTYLGGINIYNPSQKKFSYYKPNSTNQISLASNSVLAIYEDNDNDLLIGTDGGSLNLYNKEKYGEKFIDFKLDKNGKKNVCPEVVKAIYQTNDGTIWIGSYNNGLIKFDKKNMQFIYMGWEKGNPEKLAGSTIYSIMGDDNNLLWLGVWPFGVDVYDWKSNKVIKQIRQSDGFKGVYTSQILKDSKGRIWIATYEAGLNRYLASSDSFENYQYDSNNLRSLSSNQVSTIFEDSKGNIWVGTLGGGLNKYDEKTNDFTVINENYGLISNEIAGILEDKNGNFWISSYKGIFEFSPTTYKTRNYDINDGLQGKEFNDGSYFKSKDGKLYFGGTKGFNAFYPEQIMYNTFQTPLYITSFSVFNKMITINSPDSLLNQSILETKEIILPYSKTVFTLEYTALNYNRSKKNEYAYRMENFEDEWNVVGNKRYATYTNLDPGHYTFMVKATNNDGVWNEVPTTIKITITPPYWKTWWFRIFVIVSIIGLIIIIFKLRTRQLKAQKKLLEYKVQERTEELATANEELQSTNEELYDQREELQASLTRLNEAQQQLVQAEKMASLGVLSAGIAHEINNPLNFIHGGILGLENYVNEKLPEHSLEIEPLLNAVNVGVKRASDIVKSLKHYSRKDDLPPIECNMHTIIDNCLVMLQNQLKNKAEIKKKYSSDKFMVFGNEGKLHQAILNIIANAEQAISEKGTIEIETKTSKKNITIVISDSGSGINPENLQKVFDPFFTTKDPGKGTGLGLSITYNIIKEHQGTIEFESEPGIGTRVTVTLPCNKD